MERNGMDIPGKTARLFRFTATVVPVALVAHMAETGGDAGTWLDEKITTDTVTVTRVDRYITQDDTGANAKKAECEFDTVTMGHRMHEAAGVRCITCHHRHDNDERIKQCARCHKGVAGIDRMHDRCGTCHRDRLVGTSCRSCHHLGDPKKLPLRMRAGEIGLLSVTFPHIDHYSRKEDCLHCHTGLKKADWMKTGNYPEMKTCLQCHNSTKAPEQCAVCHGDAGAMKPRSHDNMWCGRSGHGREANFDRAECLMCHDESGCSQCHRGQTPYRIHPPGYRFAHGMDVKRGVVNCGMCHDSKQSCARCHEARK